MSKGALKQGAIAGGMLALLALVLFWWPDASPTPGDASGEGGSSGGHPQLESGSALGSAVDPTAPVAATQDVPVPEGPSLLILGPDEEPVIGVDVAVASYAISPVFERATDKHGVVRIPAPWADTMCSVSILSDEWVLTGDSLFPARGQSVVRLERGCVVWVRIPAESDPLIGSPCNFSADGGAFRSVPIAGRETRLGAFSGGMWRLHSIANVRARAGTRQFLLPRTGTVTVDFVPEEGRHASLVIHGPEQVVGTAWFRFVEKKEGFPRSHEFSRSSAIGTAEFPLSPGTYAYLGRWGTWLSEGHVTVPAGADPTALSPRWRAGVSLEIRTTDQAFVQKAILHVRPRSWRASDFGESGQFMPNTAGATPGRIVVADGKVPARWRRWPGEAVLDADVVRWHGLPPGGTCDVRVETSDWAAHVAALPLPIQGTAQHQLDAPRRFVVHVEAGGEPVDAGVMVKTPPGGLPPSLLASGGTIDGRATVFVDGPTLDRWKGLQIEAFCDTGKGVTAWGGDEREVTVRLGEVPWARFAVQIVTAEGTSVPNVMVSFGRVGFGNRFVLTGPDGVASARLPADATVYVAVNGTRYANEGMPTAQADEVTTLVVKPLFKLLVENGTGASFTGTVRIEAGSAKRNAVRPMRPGGAATILAGGVLEKRLLRAGDYTVVVERWMPPGERELLFTKNIRIGAEFVTRVVFR